MRSRFQLEATFLLRSSDVRTEENIQIGGWEAWYLHSSEASFKIRLTGSREKDFEECVRIYHEKTGIPVDEIEALRDDGFFVWHHLDDLDENLECTMQFAMVGPHSCSHTGSVAQFTKISGIKYK